MLKLTGGLLFSICVIPPNTCQAQQTFYASGGDYAVTIKITALQVVAAGNLVPCAQLGIGQLTSGYNWNVSFAYDVSWSGNLTNVQINQFKVSLKSSLFGTLSAQNTLAFTTSSQSGSMMAGNGLTALLCPLSVDNFGINTYALDLEATTPSGSTITVHQQDNTYPLARTPRTFTSIAVGNWSDPGSWTYSEGNNFIQFNTTLIPSFADNITVTRKIRMDTDVVIGPGKMLYFMPSSRLDTFLVAPGKTLSVDGMAYFGTYPMIIKSDATGTGRIGKSAGNIVATNMQVERYIPAKPNRKWTMLSSPVQQSFRDGWQKNIFITGSGNGGTPCGSGTGNGGAADRYNSNGFDDTQNDPASVFTYENNPVNGSRWVSIPSTTAYAIRGTGYRVNVRGSRNDANACQWQINYYGTPPPSSQAVLVATGSYNGATSVTLNATANTLLGNPFPCELSFNSFQQSNATKIAAKAWLYAGTTANVNDQYSSWNNGIFAGNGFPDGYVVNGDLVIPSGGAFFVENTGGGSVDFTEAHKSAVIANGNNLFSRTASGSWTNYVRINLLKAAADTVLDNMVVRFSEDSTVQNTTYGELDSYSFNSAASSIASLKGSSRMSIQTRRLDFINDTVKLAIGYAPGSYRIRATEFEAFYKASAILLVDKYLNTTTNLRVQPEYGFSISNDPLSQGNNRFEIIFRTGTTLPVDFVRIAAVRRNNKAQVDFSVAAEVNVKDYTLERSSTGSSFVTTNVTVAASGAMHYQVWDPGTPEALVYYRIKATDNDGKIRYSNVAKLDKAGETHLLAMYPNPVKNVLNIEALSVPVNTGYSIRVISSQGTVVKTIAGKSFSGLLQLDLSALASGVYMAQVLFSNGALQTEKIIKQ